MRTIPPSELIVNDDGSVFHLHLKPGEVADTIVLVGDPARVKQVSQYFDSVELSRQSREFCTVTGMCKGKRMTVISHGIGTDNIDIVVTELDALANIDFATRTVKKDFKQLALLRLGTSGGLQQDLRIGDLVFARTSVGFDGLLNFYEGRDRVSNLEMEFDFTSAVGWNEQLPSPYFVDADYSLAELFIGDTIDGITISASGFYGPQGRYVRLKPADEKLNEKIEAWRFDGRRITNYEMESSALAGLARLMGHRAATICTVIAQRAKLDMETDYRPFVEKMIEMSLEKLAVIK